ncbi:hypothetical protein JCM3765_005185 [Sporobolomyces pararoseus]
MPYARRSRVHQLTARQLQHLNALQRSSIPHSVAVSNSSSSSASSPSIHHNHTSLQNASIKSTSRLNGKARVFQPVVESESRGERVSIESSPSSEIAGSTERRQVEVGSKVLPGEEVQMSRPSSKRSDSQTEFQIIQRGIQGNLVLIPNESSSTSTSSETAAQPIDLIASASSSSTVQRGIHVSQHLTEDTGEEEWELLSYEEEEEEGFRNERKGINLASRLVSALA